MRRRKNRKKKRAKAQKMGSGFARVSMAGFVIMGLQVEEGQ